MFLKGTNSIAVGTAHGSSRRFDSDPERVELKARKSFDPYRVGTTFGVCDPVALPPAIELHAFSVLSKLQWKELTHEKNYRTRTHYA